jgi:hypothetical protein
MSAHIEGPVICDWCGYHLYPRSAAMGHYYHQRRSSVDNGIMGKELLEPVCPYEGRFYKVDWVLGTVVEAK